MRSLAALLSLAVAVSAQDSTQDELLAKKLAAPFLQKAAWHTDWDAAKAAAKQSGRLLFAYFTTVNH